MVETDEMIEVYVKASLETCEARDPKGLYEKARRGEIKDFTGIDAPYEEPINPEIVLDTNNIGVKESVAIIVEYLQSNGYIGCEK